MAVPTWVSGQVLTASDVNSWFVPIAGYKTSATARTTLTKSIDPDLQVQLAAGCIYQVHLGLIYVSANAMDFTFTVPASSTGGYSAAMNQAGVGAGAFSFIWTATPSTAAVTTAVVLNGMISTTNSGTFGVSWASSTGPVLCTVGVGSILNVQRVG